MLEVKNLSVFSNEDGVSSQRIILDSLSFNAEPKKITVIAGSNGAGKTTLLKAISGHVKGNGTILLDSQEINHLTPGKRATTIVKIFQDPGISTIGGMTIKENLSIALSRGKTRTLLPFRCNISLFKEKLSLLGIGLEDRLDDKVSGLSGGQRQALSLIMAIMAPAKLLLLDEITSALHHKIAKQIMDIVTKIAINEDLSVVMVSHDLNQIIDYADKILIMDEGRIVKIHEQNSENKITKEELLVSCN